MDTESRVQADQNFFILRNGNGNGNVGEITVRGIGQVTDYTLVKLTSMPNRCRAHYGETVRDPEEGMDNLAAPWSVRSLVPALRADFLR